MQSVQIHMNQIYKKCSLSKSIWCVFRVCSYQYSPQSVDMQARVFNIVFGFSVVFTQAIIWPTCIYLVPKNVDFERARWLDLFFRKNSFAEIAKQIISQYGGRGFKSDELRQTKVIHFQKADDMQNAIKGLKQQVVGGFYCIKFQKTDLCI